MVNRDNKNNKNNENNKKNNQNNLKGVITMVNRDINNNKQESRIINGAVNILKKPEFKSLSKNKAYKEYEAIVEIARSAEELFEDASQRLNDVEKKLEESEENGYILKNKNNKIIKERDSALEDLKKAELLKQSASEKINELTTALNNSTDENSKLENEKNDLIKEIKELENDNHENIVQIEGQLKEIDIRGAKIKTLEEENRKQKTTIKGYRDKYNKETNEIINLNKRIISLGEEIERAKKQYKGMKIQRDNAKEKVKEFGEKLAQAHNTIDELGEKVLKQDEEIKEYQETIENTAIEVQEIRGTIDAGLEMIQEQIKVHNDIGKEATENGNNANADLSGSNEAINYLKEEKEKLEKTAEYHSEEIKKGNNVREHTAALRILKPNISRLEEDIHEATNIAIGEAKSVYEYSIIAYNAEDRVRRLKSAEAQGNAYKKSLVDLGILED